MTSKIVQPRVDTEYRDVIQRDFPDLNISTTKIIGSGEDRVAILVNDEILFRLPRNIHSKADDNDIRSTEKETALLRLIQPSFEIPQPSYIAPDNRYFGYPFLTGSRWADVLDGQIPSDDLLREWVKTRQAISRAVTISDAERFGVPRFSIDKYVVAAMQLINEGPIAAIEHGTQDDIAYLLEHIRHDVWEFTHNDLNAENILIDKEAKKILAVLDFGDANIAPRSSDYYLWDKYPHRVMDRIAQIAHEEGDGFDVRIARTLHRLYVADDIMECRKLGQSKEIERDYWLELERCYMASNN